MTLLRERLRVRLGLWLGAAAAAGSVVGCITPARIAEVDAAAVARSLSDPNRAAAPEPEPEANLIPATEFVSTEDNLAPPAETSGDERFLAEFEEVAAQPAPAPGSFEEVQPGPIVSPNVSTSPAVRDIRDISIDIAPPPLVDDRGQPLAPPTDYATAAFAMAPPLARNDIVGFSDAVGIAPAGLEFCYQPLYFEEVNLERYGRSFGILQPLVSAGQFYSRTAMLPYHVFSQPARRCTYHPHWTLPGYRIPCWEW